MFWISGDNALAPKPCLTLTSDKDFFGHTILVSLFFFFYSISLYIYIYICLCIYIYLFLCFSFFTVSVCVYSMCIYQPLCMSRMWCKVWFLSRVQQVWIQSFPSLHQFNKVKERSLSYYLYVARERIFGFILFKRVLAWCEIPTALSRIWTWVTVSISYANNHYTMYASKQWLYILPFNHISKMPLVSSCFLHNAFQPIIISFFFLFSFYLGHWLNE